MPVKTIFVDSCSCRFEFEPDGTLLVDGSAMLPCKDVQEFAAWLNSELEARGLSGDNKPEEKPTVIDPDDYPVGEWIEYTGKGECPVPGDWEVSVKFVDGYVIHESFAGDWDWDPMIGEGVITHFKIVSKA